MQSNNRATLRAMYNML